MSETPIHQILTEQMDRLGLNPHSLAMAAGLKKDAVRDVLRGKAHNPRSKTIRSLSAYLGIPVAVLLGEGSVEMPKVPAEPHLPPNPPGRPEREEILRLWDRMDPQARRIAVFMMRAIAKETGATPEEDPGS